MSDRFGDSDANEKRSGRQPDEAGRKAGDEDEWEDEAEEGSGGGSEEWVEEAPGEAPSEWVEEEPASAGKSKPKEAPAYVSWLAGVLGLLLGLFAFRSCGQ